MYKAKHVRRGQHARHVPVLFSRYRATAPATKGTACDVPERNSVAESLARDALMMSAPGAHMLTHFPAQQPPGGLLQGSEHSELEHTLS